MTLESPVPVTRERRLANLRATMARSGGGMGGADIEPARAPFAGRRSPELAGRLAQALAADVVEDAGGVLFRRVVPPVEIPVCRERLPGLDAGPATSHGADALAVAICHALMPPLARLAS